MPLFMYQAAYSSDSWAAQVKNPQNRVETVGRQLCEAAGGKFVGGWLCFGEYDLVLIADVPNNESMAAIAMAVAAGGKARASKTTPLITGAEGVAALRQADAVAKAYKELDMKRSMAAAGR
ncbi:MAG: GYD domain-containing protein [Acetobacteraceae bacterium]|nr:GYD domain-containing protein [Acetobacteraceae bacterium]